MDVAVRRLATTRSADDRCRGLRAWPDGAGRSPAGPTSSSGTRQGKWRCRRTSSRWTGSRSCAGSRGPRRRPADRGDDEPRRAGRRPGHPRALDGHRRCRLDRRLAGDRHVGTLGGNIANASPAAETSGPLLCFEREVERPVGDGRAPDRARRPVQRPGPDDAPSGRADRRGRPARARWRAAALRPARVPPADGDRGRRRDGRRGARGDGVVRDARIAITAARPDGPAGRRRPRRRSSGRMAGRRRPRRRAAGRRTLRADRRRPRLARRTAGRWPRSSSAGRSPWRSRGLAGRRSRSRPAPAPSGARSDRCATR